MNEFEKKKIIMDLFYKNRGGFVSGEDMSGLLGFSRASTWKYIEKLREDGYGIEAVSNRGYRLSTVPDKLYGYDLAAELKTQVVGKGNVYYYSSLGSTNDKAYELADKGEPEGTVVISEMQTAGKGRLGRKWESPEDGGIYVSLILRPELNIRDLAVITLIAAVSLVKALKDAVGCDAGIKWPNDIYLNNKKIAGILTEIKAQPDRVDFLILGIGLNVNTSVEDLPSEGSSLYIENGKRSDRRDILRNILECFERDYFSFREKGFQELREESKIFSVLLGKNVEVQDHHNNCKGTVIDIDIDGALVVEKEDKSRQKILSGDVLLCREEGIDKR